MIKDILDRIWEKSRDRAIKKKDAVSIEDGERGIIRGKNGFLVKGKASDFQDMGDNFPQLRRYTDGCK